MNDARILVKEGTMPGDLERKTVALIESLGSCRIDYAVWDEREAEAFLVLDDGRIIGFSAFGIDDSGALDVSVINVKQLTKRQRLLLEGS